MERTLRNGFRRRRLGTPPRRPVDVDIMASKGSLETLVRERQASWPFVGLGKVESGWWPLRRRASINHVC